MLKVFMRQQRCWAQEDKEHMLLNGDNGRAVRAGGGSLLCAVE